MSTQTPKEKAYESAPLEYHGQIRLVDLEPGKGDDEIHCEIRPVDLEHVRWRPEFDEAANPPSYEALSYVWGDPEITAPVVCSGSTIQITTNLHAALKRLRLADRSRTLWVDAVCINQSDIPERNQQVRKMRQIYSGASQVIVWLGESDEQDPFKNLSAFLQQLASESPTSLYSVPESVDWSLFADFFNNEYFSRKWMVQEFAVARALKVCKGGSEHNLWLKQPGKSMGIPIGDGGSSSETVITQVIASGSLLAPVEIASAKVANDMVNSGTLIALWTTMQLADIGFPLSFVLARTSDYRVSIFKDHIIAVINLASDLDAQERQYLIDYSLSLDELVIRTARTLLSKEGLHGLASPIGDNVTWESQSVHREGFIPSWVPRHLFRNKFSDLRYLSEGNRGSPVPLKPVNDRLFIKGRILGQIATYGTFLEPEIILSYPACRRRLCEWVNFLNKPSSGESGNSLQQFWGLLTTFALSDPSPIATATPPGSAIFGANYDEESLRRILDNALQLSLDEIILLPESSIEKLIWNMLSEMQEYLLCYTNKGSLGFAGQRAQLGDSVFVCGEGEIHTLILRRKSNGEYSTIAIARFVGAAAAAAEDNALTEEIIIS